jgi:hypothetical protein
MLQFETAIPAGETPAASSAQAVACQICQQPIRDEYFDANGHAVCRSCGTALSAHGEPLRGAGTHVRAALFGFVAAVAGALLYYAIVRITSLEIGLVAIAIGYMVGYAMRKATGGRGGRLVQVMAIVLTYWSVGLAYLPLVIQAVDNEKTVASSSPEASSSRPIASPGTTDSPTATSQPTTEPRQRTSREPRSAGSSLLAIAMLFGLTFALPVLTVISSLPGGLISAVIIGFGMQQAWKMTGAPQLAITGPFRVQRVSVP